jgi:hypothetical protein
MYFLNFIKVYLYMKAEKTFSQRRYMPRKQLYHSILNYLLLESQKVRENRIGIRYRHYWVDGRE